MTGREPGRDRSTDDAATADGDRPTAAPTMAAQLDAMNGGPIAPLTDHDLTIARECVKWFAITCAGRGMDAPPDVMRALIACAWQVVSYNIALDQQAQAEADANAPRH